MTITISSTRELPKLSRKGRGARPTSLRSILESMVKGQSFFLREKGDAFSWQYCSDEASRLKKGGGSIFTVRSTVEDGVPGFVVYCLGKPE